MTSVELEGPDLVVQFLNTVDVEDSTDVLDDAATWSAWCADRGLVPGERADARALRDGLRDAVDGLQTPLPPAQVVLTHGPDGLRLGSASDDAVARILVEVTTLVATDRLARVKLCPAHDCRWAFFDRSRNHTRTWCDMGVCGNRAKVRTFRARRQTDGGAPV
jgi:predicted RNA-binding Zn ribbon-like protein